MSRLFQFLVLGLSLLSFFGAGAQPSILLTDTEVQEGDEFAIVLSMKDVTDISKISFTLNWDTTFLEFNSTEGITENSIDFPGLDDADFIPREEGAIGMDWNIADLPIPDQALTLPGNDWYSVFRASFIAKKSGQTSFSIGDIPIPFILERFQGNNFTEIQRRDSIFGGNIIINPSTDSTGSQQQLPPPPPAPPSMPAEDLNFTFTVDNDISCIGDRICYSISVENFDSISLFQFPLNWNQSILEFDQAENFNLDNFTQADIGGTPSDGFIRVIYTGDINDPVHLLNGATVPDSTSIVDICFNVIGESNNQQSIFVGQESNDQLSTESVNKDGESVTVEFTTSPIETLDCEETVILESICNTGVSGERVCIDIQPIIFQNVGSMFFSLNWDQSVLTFVGLDTSNPDLDNLSIDARSDNLDVNWSLPFGATEGVTLTRTDLPIATLCFDINANATEGDLLEFNYSNEAFFGVDGGLPIDDVRLEGCAIEVMEAPIPEPTPLPEPILSAADEEVEVGEDVCVDILVENFTGVTSFEFPVLWDNDKLEFQGIMSQAFTDINIDSTTASNGSILANWGSATGSPETLPGKAVLFSICFTAIEEPSSAILFFQPIGQDEFFFIENDLLTSTSEAGEVTIVPSTTPPPPPDPPVTDPPTPDPPSPVTFSTGRMDNLARNRPFCVPVTVKDFEEIFNATILVTWDSTVISLDSLSNIRLPDVNPINLGTNTPGQLSLIWSDANDELITIDDGEVIFELCFTTIGDIGDCTGIEFPSSIDDGSLPGAQNLQLAEIINDPAINTDGEHIGIVDEGSEICITTFGIEDFILVEPSCDVDGSINAIIAGGQDGYTYTWKTNEIVDPTLGSDGPSQNRLLSAQVDSVCLTVFNFNLDQSDTRCIAVEVDDTRIPTVTADINGRDTIDVGCVDPDLHETQLRGDFEESQDTGGGVINGKWTAIPTSGGSIQPFSDSDDEFEAIAVGIGTYVFTITNGDGCTDSDTLVIVDSAAPTLSITPDNDELNCTVSQIVLTGTSSDTGAEFDFAWTDSSGDTLPTGVDPFQLEIEQGGIYNFSINNSNNGCNSTEAITVRENITIVNAEAGPPTVELRCEDDAISLDGRQSDTGGNFRTEWTSDNDIVRPLSLTPDISKVGTYFLRITDNANGCFGTDSILVIADTELPVAKVRDEAFIGCNQSRTVLRSITDGLDGTSVGAKFEYTWTTADGAAIISQEDTAEVSILGEYLFIVINTENDACAADTARVQVVENTTLPEFTIPTGQTISCMSDCIELQVETANIGSDFSYEWTTDVGNLCSGANSLNAQVDEVGTYFLVVTNTANNCSDTSSVNIFPDPDNGVFPEAGPTREITCQQDTVLLNGSASSSSTGNAILYEWRFGDEEEILTTDPVLMATEPGRYRLTVIDEAAECQGSGSVEVIENIEFPIADAGSNFPLTDCVVEPFNLNALNSDRGDEITYQWNTMDGEIVSDETTLTPTVSQLGTYTLVVTNESSGCSSTSDVVVSSEVFSPAAIVEETERSLDCNENTIVLDASSSFTGGGTNTATIEWTTLDGNIISGADTELLVVDSAGTYTLTLTADNGCIDQATVVVTNMASLPVVDAGEGFRLTCNEQMTLDASNSSFNDNNIVIQWTTNDGSIVAGANTLMPEINLGGTYTLVITDTTNNCRVEDMVVIESDGILPSAQAGENIEVCGREADLSASPTIDGITGIWSVLNGGQIDENDPLTNVTNLFAGENQFIWTLSSDECPDFSADTVTVNALTLPIAEDDDFEFIVGQGTTVPLDLVGNDLPNTDNFSINIIREPTSAILSRVSEGVFSLDLPSRPTRQDFQYEICSATCADVCASATVSLVVRPEASESDLEFNPNAITPNGDGLNDELIFDELFIEDFPQSELVIFNRWGDVVYRVSPYNNDWQGSGNDGEEITEGTYYYILRLDISEGDIIRGDVTVLR